MPTKKDQKINSARVQGQSGNKGQNNDGAPATNPGFAVRGHWIDVTPPANGLYIVSTPIGNLNDISLRALEILAGCDLILCEDTRTSAKLLDHFAIKTKRIALHEHNERQKTASILRDLEQGRSVALISDAGTPLLSDPGFPLVRAARAAHLEVFAVPGASALLAGLAIAGLPTDQFSFIGFLPPKQGARLTLLDQLKTRRETLVFYESPRRLAASSKDLFDVFGDRLACVAVELTKRFERTYQGPLSDLVAQFEAEPQKGEVVIIVSGAADIVIDEAAWQQALIDAMEQMPLRQAVDEITKQFGLKRKAVYDAALAAKKK